jgi:ribosomal protein L11 methyltransferase
MANSSTKWIELSVQAHPEAVDAIAEVFRAHGTGGVAIEQSVRSDPEGEESPILVGLPRIKAYLPVLAGAPEQEQEIEKALWHLQAFDLSPVGPLERREVDEEDWANAWKQHFHPLKIGRVVIKPSWRDWQTVPDDVVVRLDPGMAFGTGLHPSTRMTLAALQSRISPSMRVLDLGTGSGILGITAAAMGADVTALDISETAVEVARRNVAENGLSDQMSVALGSIEAVSGRQFHVILANIIAGVLADLAPELAAALLPGAELLASGIIEERADSVRQAFRQSGLVLDHQEHDGDWWLFGARRTA